MNVGFNTNYHLIPWCHEKNERIWRFLNVSKNKNQHWMLLTFDIQMALALISSYLMGSGNTLVHHSQSTLCHSVYKCQQHPEMNPASLGPSWSEMDYSKGEVQKPESVTVRRPVSGSHIHVTAQIGVKGTYRFWNNIYNNIIYNVDDICQRHPRLFLYDDAKPHSARLTTVWLPS